MCTVTFLQRQNLLLVTMNRDELRSRVAEIPPQQYPASRGYWMAPADGQPPNTWIGVNQLGFGGCILNRYQDPGVISGAVSRGVLLPELLSTATTPAPDVRAWLDEQPLQRMAAFTLVTFQMTGVIHRYDWTGKRILGPVDVAADSCTFEGGGERWSLLSSSSWRTRAVNRWRCLRFQEWGHGGSPFQGKLPAIHVLKSAEMCAWTPIMSRRESCTRSITQVRIDMAESLVEISYWPEPHPSIRIPHTQIKMSLKDGGQGNV